MLYKFSKDHKSIELMPYYDFGSLKKKEKDLENLLAENLSNLYIEDGGLMSIFQERAMQEEPDLCALDKNGNLILFELKRGEVQGGTTIQIMRYAQYWGHKSYHELNESYEVYCNKHDLTVQELRDAHKDAFGLDNALTYDQFNRKQKLIIAGSSSDTELISAVDYWKSQGIDMDFIPYRIYEIGGEYYFEYYSKPYDTHINPKDTKGIIFDTNSTYDENAIWDMISNHKVSAYGKVAKAVYSFRKEDYVLYYHKGYGIVAAGKIKSDTKEIKQEGQDDEFYRDVDLLTPEISELDYNRCIPYSELCDLLNKSFFLARTTKVPYLSEVESKMVVDRLKEKFGK